MRSIFARILLWALGTIALSLAGFAATSRLLAPRGGRVDFIARTQALQREGALRAYEEGGRDGLARYLRRLDELFVAEHHLVDAAGADLVDGSDRSTLLAIGAPGTRPRRLPDGRAVVCGPPRDGAPRLLILVPPGPREGIFWPYYLWIVLVIVGLGYALAVHLAAPLRRLRNAVDRFGQGDLAARADLARRDEIGELARAFDAMAGRIETLLAAERRLLQDVSHELRSPLARLGFAVELARTGDDREAALARVRKEADRISALVGQLLELTRVEGDPAAASREDVPLHDLLADLVADCDLEARARGCRLALQAERPTVVPGDRELLRRAVENVVRNAIRHAPEGTAVEVALESAPGAARVVVRDCGPGVPDEALGEIFRPFVRVEGDRSRASGGVGLGLAIARRAIDLHRGSIAARNAHPGLAVVIELPRAR